jgi:hypothetical protein
LLYSKITITYEKKTHRFTAANGFICTSKHQLRTAASPRTATGPARRTTATCQIVYKSPGFAGTLGFKIVVTLSKDRYKPRQETGIIL